MFVFFLKLNFFQIKLEKKHRQNSSLSSPLIINSDSPNNNKNSNEDEEIIKVADKPSCLISSSSTLNSIVKPSKSVLINCENDIIINPVDNVEQDEFLPIITQILNNCTNTTKNEENSGITNTTNYSSASSITSVPANAMKESPPLKRSHAITDLVQMDDFSPVTFDTSLNIKSEDVTSATINNLSNIMEICQATSSSIIMKNNTSIQVEEDLVGGGNGGGSSKCEDLIEETKLVIIGVKIRGAKVSKLVEILIESFDDSGHVLYETDFPRVFLLMHKWFIESELLANMLYDLYIKHDNDNEILITTHTNNNNISNNLLLNKHSVNYQLKICHTFRFVFSDLFHKIVLFLFHEKKRLTEHFYR
jgi:hypothetical protein